MQNFSNNPVSVQLWTWMSPATEAINKVAAAGEFLPIIPHPYRDTDRPGTYQSMGQGMLASAFIAPDITRPSEAL